MKNTNIGLHARLVASQVWTGMNPTRSRRLGVVGFWSPPTTRCLWVQTFAARQQKTSVITAELVGRMRSLDQMAIAVSRHKIARIVDIARVVRSGAKAARARIMGYQKWTLLCHATHARPMVASPTRQRTSASAVPTAQTIRTVVQITLTSVPRR